MLDYFKALGDENRLKIFFLLSMYELCVCEIEVLLDLTQSNVSRHLSRLKQAKLIVGLKDAQWMHYKLDEQFKLNNQHLYDYLMYEFARLDEFKLLKQKCMKYKNSAYSCQTITNDKALVINFLEEDLKPLF
ncbi:MAG: winged helix-turn-helix transcriptional regulator [Clostridia bacterium]|nr:winged helix-turn-helix transcriptional regulator [Clostridia bacterium]